MTMFSSLMKNDLPRRDLCFFKYSSSLSLVKSISTDTTTHNSTFALSYLINTCGVSQAKAISWSKRLNFESSENPDTVLSLFRNSGFSNTQISKIMKTYPSLLLSNVDKTLKPKFEFFKSQGITETDFAEIVYRNPKVLNISLEKKIIPCFELMRSIVHTDAQLVTMLRRSTSVLSQDPNKNFIPNVALLRAQGVPAHNIAKSLVAQPNSFMILASRLREIVEEVKKMKFDPKQFVFLVAVHGLSQMSRSTLEAKFDVYRKWGLSEDELQLIFQKNPRCLMISEKNIMSTMNFYVKEIGYTPSLIAKQPNVIMFSLERRIIPRCSVIQILKAKGLIGDEGRLEALLAVPEEVFLDKYVVKFEKEVPELLSVYKEKGR